MNGLDEWSALTLRSISLRCEWKRGDAMVVSHVYRNWMTGRRRCGASRLEAPAIRGRRQERWRVRDALNNGEELCHFK